MSAANDDTLRELRLEVLPAGGIVVWVSGEPFAAFTTPRELCHWLEVQLSPLVPDDAAADEQPPQMLRSGPAPGRPGTLSRVASFVRGS